MRKLSPARVTSFLTKQPPKGSALLFILAGWTFFGKATEGGFILSNVNFAKAFQQFIGNRILETCDSLLRDPEYQKFRADHSALGREIQKLLGPENGFKLLNELSELTGALMALQEDYAYKQGLRDGIELRRELGLLS